MAGKGIIKFFLVVVSLFCALQYFYMFPTIGVENDAEAFATIKAANVPEEKKDSIFKAAENGYLDSMSSEIIFSIPLIKKYTYDDLKAAQLALGLDLKGGMSLVLQVDLRELIQVLSDHSTRLTFTSALDKADIAMQGSQADYVTLFANAFKEEAAGKEKLADIFSRGVLRGEIDFETSDDKVIALLRQKANETVSLTYQMLKDRIDQLGVVQPNVSLDAARDLIIVELPGITNPERARKFMKKSAKLEFWDTYRINDPGVLDAFLQADEKLRKLNSNDTTEVVKITQYRIDTTFVVDSLGNPTTEIASLDSTVIEDFQDPLSNQGPLLSALQLNASAGGQALMPLSVMGIAKKNQIKIIDDYLSKAAIKVLFPRDLEFRWALKPASGYIEESTFVTDDSYELYAIKKVRGKNTAPLEGNHVISASSSPDPQTGEIQVSLRMDGTGAKIWGEMTTKAYNNGQREIAIVLDGKVVSAPGLRNGPILGGNSSISGNFSLQEAEDLAKFLQIGKLPANIQIIQESLVGPSLGAENINRSINSLLIGFGIVLLFMVFYYSTAGIVSILALFLNLFFIFGSLASLGTVLTLPGIAGIVLTIGMAVDANVIIYERIREELREGKTLLMSIRDGFQNSYSAIIDANVTTILVAGVLAYFGMGPIKGFAVVLIIGVISSLFTAVLVGRLMIDWWTSKDRDLKFYTGISKGAFANLKIDWLGKRKMAYVLSSAIILIGMGSFFMKGFELGVDFKGGYSYNVQFDKSISVDADLLRTELSDAFGSAPVVKAVSTGNAYNITTSYLINDNSDDAADRVLNKLFEGVNATVGGSLNIDHFKKPDADGTHISQSSKVGPTIASDIKTSSLYATIFALFFIFLYIFARFNKWQYSLGAVAALFHDVLFVLSIFSLFHGILPFSMEIDQAFIAAILTVIGYSINDTVVVFDRVREFMNAYSKRTKTEVINMAINSTVSRTIITSLTTLFVVSILFAFGGGSIRGFAFALMVGIIVGTYSSIFIATPIMSDFSGELKPKESKKKSFSKAANV
jgi:SecD/SecF fusion protein